MGGRGKKCAGNERTQGKSLTLVDFSAGAGEVNQWGLKHSTVMPAWNPEWALTLSEPVSSPVRQGAPH